MAAIELSIVSAITLSLGTTAVTVVLIKVHALYWLAISALSTGNVHNDTARRSAVHSAPPYPEQPGEGHFWYGTQALWTSLGRDGVWQSLPYRNGGYVQKMLWWREDYSPATEPTPEFTTTLRRLDLPGEAIVQSGASHGYHPELISFIVGGVHIPSPGCWEITGQYKEAQLSFVIWVAP